MALTDNIVSYWKLDESSGNASDSVASNTATNTNVTYTTGKINNWATFNGTNARFVAWSTISWTTAFTLMAWVKAASKTKAWILTKRDSNAAWIMFRQQSTAYQAFYLYSWGFVFATTGTTTCFDNTRHHIAVTRSWTAVKSYVDWVLDINWTASSNMSLVTHWLKFGNDSVDNAWLNWMMDEVGVWNRALTQSEIQEIYNSWTGIQYPFSWSSSIKTVNDLAKASVKTVKDLAIASVKTINDLA